MKKNILLRTNLLVCLVIVTGFLMTAVLSYRANYSASIQNIEQVSTLTSEGIYYQMSSTFTKPVNISLTMANDSLLRSFLSEESAHLDNDAYVDTIREYLNTYQEKYGYDSVFLVSTATGRYYNFNGLNRVLTRGNPENEWYFQLLDSDLDYAMQVDNDEAANNEITVFVNCKIQDETGSTLGIVGVGLRVDHLQGLLKTYQEQFGVEAFLVDEQGFIQISSLYTGYEAVDLFSLSKYGDGVREDVLNWREEGTARSFWTAGPASGADQYYIVARYLPELDWHLVVERDTGLLMAELNQQLAGTMLIIAGIIVVILYVITHVIRGFNHQIISLTQSMEQERRTIFEEATEQLFENIYELDITHNRPANLVTERYFENLGIHAGTPYDQALPMVTKRQIKEEFRQGYIDTFSPENVLRAYAAGEETLRYEFMIAADDDEYYWMRITGRIVCLQSDGSIHLFTYRQNIDAEKRREERILELSQMDEMTGLYTKTATQRQIQKLLRDDLEQQFAFFIFDIDVFKQANDQYGHAFGDSVIHGFADTLQQHFRSSDLIGRIGGDEFVVFIPVPDEAWVVKKAQELSTALDRVHTDSGHSWKMSASIGISLAPRDGTNFSTLYKRADLALYETKKRGKNSFTLYSPQMGQGEQT